VQLFQLYLMADKKGPRTLAPKIFLVMITLIIVAFVAEGLFRLGYPLYSNYNTEMARYARVPAKLAEDILAIEENESADDSQPEANEPDDSQQSDDMDDSEESDEADDAEEMDDEEETDDESLARDLYRPRDTAGDAGWWEAAALCGE